MQPEPCKRRNTREAIFLAAAELFAERGYLGTSMKEIAEKAGIKAASIYNHYPAKENLMDELLQHYLNRMDAFHQRLASAEISITEQSQLPQALNNLMLAYEPHEKQLMYWLTRIVHHEQFSFPSAADALIGSGYRKYVNAHIHFFNRLSAAGLIHGTEHNRFYGELYARLSLTFATQFLHPEIEPTIADQTDISNFIHQLVLAHEQTLCAK